MHERLAVRIASIVARVEEVLLGTAVLVIATMTVGNVFCRTFLGFSLSAADEVSQASIIVVCFVGLSYAAGRGRHIRMTALSDHVPTRLQKALFVALTAGTASLLFVLAWYAVEYVATVRRLGGVSPVLRIPYWMVYLVAPVGLVMAGFQYALATAKNLGSPRVSMTFTQVDGADFEAAP